MATDKRLEWDLTAATNVDFDNYAKLKERNLQNENKQFIYPGPYARNIAGTKTNQKMQRGFMRSIIMGGDIAKSFKVNSPGNIRLNFQFNPEYIERRVSQSIGAVNPLLQNPANLTQAVPGTAQFNFTMTFNREAEVANSKGLNLIATSNDFLVSDIEDSLKDPAKVGVMHDLAVFDKIIGQGISKDLIDVITAYTQQQVVMDGNEAVSNVPKDGDTATPTSFDSSAFATSINANFGNSAFLNPMPVRIVFSDLFMVEGLVVGSAVAFQKFSQQMIPTVCQVNCEIYALYVGFAKRKAFLTDNLTTWANTAALDAVKDAENTATIKKQMAQRVKKVSFIMNSSTDEVASEDRENLEVPELNSSGARIIKPVITNSFYAGNVSDEGARFVTVPQWFNAFSGNTFYPTKTNDISSAHRQFFTYDQVDNNSSKVGWLPLHIVMQYAALKGQEAEMDADFDIKVTLVTPHGTKIIEVSPKDKWEKGDGPPEYPTPYGKDVYSRVFWLKPEPVSIKESIQANARCTFNVVLTMRQSNIEGVSGQLTVDFKPITLSYSHNAPLFYKGTTYTDNNATIVKAIVPTPNLPNTGSGGGPKDVM